MSLLDSVDFHDPGRRERLVEVRRDLHQYPELGFEEERTAGIVAERLRELGIPCTEGVARTGVVGLIEGGRPGPTVLLRADMDALPLPEANDVPYRSRVAGKMHACGHDAHVSILLEVAAVLWDRREELPGKVKLVFQPAEEGPGGAKPMIDAGVMRDPVVHYALGLHVWVELEVGGVGILPGPAMAAVDVFDCTITARGGHAAAPHQTPDPILCAAGVVHGWQAILGRESDPLHPGVLSVTKLDGGFAHNIIPAEVHLKGTIRTFDEDLQRHVEEAMDRILQGVTDAYRCGYRFEHRGQYPATINDEGIAAEMKAVAEDMSYFLREVPGCFMFLGAGPPGVEDPSPHHCETFDIDEDCLPHGVELLCRGALHLMENDPRGLAGAS
jgi:amidohydrolase